MSSIDASIHIWGVNLDPELITKALNIKPTRSQKTGDQYNSTSGQIRFVKCGMWELSSSNNISSDCLNEHLAWIIAHLNVNCSIFSILETIEEARMDIVISEDSEGNTIEFGIDAETLGKLALLQLPLCFTVY